MAEHSKEELQYQINNIVLEQNWQKYIDEADGNIELANERYEKDMFPEY